MTLKSKDTLIISTLREEYRSLMREYNDNHKCCPNCKSTGLQQTYVGYIMNTEKPHEYRDENSCKCKCGWSGIVHQLIGCEFLVTPDKTKNRPY